MSTSNLPGIVITRTIIVTFKGTGSIIIMTLHYVELTIASKGNVGE